MEAFIQRIKNFWNNDEGVTSIEYVLLASLIMVVIAVAVTSLGVSVLALFNQVVAAY